MGWWRRLWLEEGSCSLSPKPSAHHHLAQNHRDLCVKTQSDSKDNTNQRKKWDILLISSLWNVCATNFRATLICPLLPIRGRVDGAGISDGTWKKRLKLKKPSCILDTTHKQAFTLLFNVYSLISVLLKSHADKSRSTSPRKLFRPKESLCHTETFKVCDFRSSIGILNC